MSPLVSPFVEINGARSDDRCRDFQKTCYKVVVRMSEDLFFVFFERCRHLELTISCKLWLRKSFHTNAMSRVRSEFFDPSILIRIICDHCVMMTA